MPHQALDAANARAKAAAQRAAAEAKERERLAASLASCQAELRAAQTEVARLQRERVAGAVGSSAGARGRVRQDGVPDDEDVEGTIGGLLALLASEQSLRSDLDARLAATQQRLNDARVAESQRAAELERATADARAAAAETLRSEMHRLRASEEQRSRSLNEAHALVADLRQGLAACLSDAEAAGLHDASSTTSPQSSSDAAAALAGKHRFVLWLAAERKKREDAERRLDDVTEELARSEHSRREATQRWLDVASQLSTVAAVAPDVAAAAAASHTPPQPHAGGDMMVTSIAAFTRSWSPEPQSESGQRQVRPRQGIEEVCAPPPLSFVTALQAGAGLVPELVRRVAAGQSPQTAAWDAAAAAAQAGVVSQEHVSGMAMLALGLAAVPVAWLLSAAVNTTSLWTWTGDGSDAGMEPRGAAAAWGLLMGIVAALLRLLRWILQL